jgi:hypothetical protein
VHRGRRKQDRNVILWDRRSQGAAWYGMRGGVVVTMHKRPSSRETCKTSSGEENSKVGNGSRYFEIKKVVAVYACKPPGCSSLYKVVLR